MKNDNRIVRKAMLFAVSIVLMTSCTFGQKTGSPSSPDVDSGEFGRYESQVPAEFRGIGAKFYKNIPYGAGTERKVDLLLPEGPGSFPVLVFFHGGGFVGGNKEVIYSPRGPRDAFHLAAKEAVKSGIALAAVSYTKLRTPGNEGIKSALEDGQRSVKFLRYHASRLGLDGESIAVFGGSAGGGIALWIATTEQNVVEDAEGGRPEYLGVSPSVVCAAALNSQASYDVEKWFSEIFTDYDLNRNDLLSGKEAARIKAIYNVRSLDEFNGPKGVAYRKSMDFLELLDAGDPPIWMGSPKGDAPEPRGFQDMFHHPAHVRALKLRSDKLDVPTGKNHFIVPAYQIETPKNSTLEGFLIGHLKP